MAPLRFLPVLLAGLLMPSLTRAGDKKDDPLAALLAQLKAADAAARLEAVIALADHGPAAAPAVPALIGLFEDKDEHLRVNAGLTLSKIGKPAVGALGKALDHADGVVRFYAVWTLGLIGPDAKSVAARVIGLLSDADAGVRRKAAFAAGRIGAEPKMAVKALVACFDDKQADVQQAAVEAVGKFGPAALPTLQEALKSERISIAKPALKALEALGAEAAPALPEVESIFLMGDSAICAAAGSTLAKIGKPALPALKRGLASESLIVRNQAVRSMAQMGAPAVPDLVDALASSDPELRRQAAQALGPLRISDRMVVQGLAHAALDKDQQTSHAALRALAVLGPAASEAGAKVVQLLDRPGDTLSIQIALSTLFSIRGDPKDVLPALAKLLEGELPQAVRFTILRLLPGYGSDAIPLIVPHLKNDDLLLRRQTLGALSNVSGDLSGVLADLEPFLRDKEAVLRAGAVRCLGRAGPKAVKPLLTALKDVDPSVRWSAATSLGNIGAPAAEAIAALEEATRDANALVRANAQKALAKIRGK